jgi:uncharacterized protein YggE
MAQTAKPSHSRLRPTPKALEKALKDSATQARRMAEAFGLKVPGVIEKQVKTLGSAATTRRKVHA